MDVKKWKKQGIFKSFSLKNMKKDQMLILFLAGVLLLIIALPTGGKDGEDTEAKSEEGIFPHSKDQESDDREDYTMQLEQRLSETLSQMEGVGSVKVMITLRSSAEKVVEKDLEAANETVTESDSQGGSRTTQNSSHTENTVYNGADSQSQEPYISKELSPQIEGVVVIADGGADSLVKQNITEAVQALFGIDTHKIRIMKKNQK